MATFCRDISQLKSADDESGNIVFFSTLVGTYLPTFHSEDD